MTHGMWTTAHRLTRLLRWMLWAGFLGYSARYVYNTPQHLDQFGHLTLTTELIMFAFPLAAVTAGLFELMFRDWAVAAARETIRQAQGEPFQQPAARPLR